MRAWALIFLIGAGQPLAAAAPPDPITTYRKRQQSWTAAEVLGWLQAGNRRFQAGASRHGGYPEDARERVRVAASSQRPLAAVLPCIDSRAAPEIVFDTTVGDLFTTRIAGNVISDDVLASLEVSVASGVKVVVVMGHTDCGAVKGACRGIEFEHLTGVLEKVKPAITATHALLDADPKRSRQVGERVPSNPRYVAAIGHTNAQRSVRRIRERSTFLAGKVAVGEIRLVSALYDVRSGRVLFDPPPRRPQEKAL